MAPEIHQGRVYGPEVDWWSLGCVMFDTMLGMCRSEDLFHPERYPLYLAKDAASILNMFLNTDPGRRLRVRSDTHSILMHPFFKVVNWEPVLQKCVTLPVKPMTMEFLTVDSEAPGDADES
jgi:serine/threonine protein kinase